MWEGRKAGRQEDRQAGRQAGRQEDREVTSRPINHRPASACASERLRTTRRSGRRAPEKPGQDEGGPEATCVYNPHLGLINAPLFYFSSKRPL